MTVSAPLDTLGGFFTEEEARRMQKTMEEQKRRAARRRSQIIARHKWTEGDTNAAVSAPFSAPLKEFPNTPWAPEWGASWSAHDRRTAKVTAGGFWRATFAPVALYFMQDLLTGFVKIGVSKDVDARIAGLDRTGAGHIRLLGVIERGGELENFVHRLLNEYLIRGEWFLPSPAVMEIAEDPTWMGVVEAMAYHEDRFRAQHAALMALLRQQEARMTAPRIPLWRCGCCGSAFPSEPRPDQRCPDCGRGGVSFGAWVEVEA